MKNKIFLLLVMLLFLSNNLYAQKEPSQSETPKPSLGLSVQPGGILIQRVKLGETYDLYEKSGIALIIENKDIRPHTYTLTTSKPSEIGNKKWLKGYSEIPNPTWFWFEKDETTVGPQSRQEVKMFLKIPEEEKYYNQRWTVSVGVTGKHEMGEMLTLAVYPRYQIETEAKTGLKERPDGTIGFEPSMLLFKNVSLGKKETAKVIIYNNDEKAHKYKITPEIIKVGPTREQIVPSPGYSWIPKKRWIKANTRRVKIEPGETEELTITVKIPKRKKYHAKRWESLIFVEPDEGSSGFVRVQIETNK